MRSFEGRYQARPGTPIVIPDGSRSEPIRDLSVRVHRAIGPGSRFARPGRQFPRVSPLYNPLPSGVVDDLAAVVAAGDPAERGAKCLAIDRDASSVGFTAAGTPASAAQDRRD